MSEAHKITAAVTKCVRKSIFKTMTASSGGVKSVSFAPVGLDVKSVVKGSRVSSSVSLKSYSIDPRFPHTIEWIVKVAVPVKVYRNGRIKSMNALQAPMPQSNLAF